MMVHVIFAGRRSPATKGGGRSVFGHEQPPGTAALCRRQLAAEPQEAASTRPGARGDAQGAAGGGSRGCRRVERTV